MTNRRLCIVVGSLLTAVLMCTSVSASKVDYSSEEVIKKVQEELNAAGFDCGNPDGVAGSGTKAAIRQYREANGLEQGEEIDADLFNALMLNDEQKSFISAVLDVTDGGLGKGEELEEITLYDNDLYLSVDMGDTSDLIVPVDDLALTRVSSLTDPILDLEDYESLWETVTVDFGDIGAVVNGKDNIRDDGYGKYFDMVNFELKQGDEISDEGSSASPSGGDAEIKDIESALRDRITSEYANTDISGITINEDLGTENPNDWIVLVYLTWNVKNSEEMTEKVLKMYSDDVAVLLANQFENVQEVAVFWEVPYLSSNTSKWSYERKQDGMYQMDVAIGW